MFHPVTATQPCVSGQNCVFGTIQGKIKCFQRNESTSGRHDSTSGGSGCTHHTSCGSRRTSDDALLCAPCASSPAPRAPAQPSPPPAGACRTERGPVQHRAGTRTAQSGDPYSTERGPVQHRAGTRTAQSRDPYSTERGPVQHRAGTRTAQSGDPYSAEQVPE